MGIVYTLVKRKAPEAFNLGKGRPYEGWSKVFGRYHGIFVPRTNILIKNGNFEESFRIDTIPDLEGLITKYNNYYFDNCSIVAERIKSWAKDSEVFLINYWEEIEYYKEARKRKAAEEEFKDLRPFLPCSLYDYKIVGSVYD